MAKPIGTLGNIDILTAGQFFQKNYTDLTGMIALYGSVNAASANTTPRKPNGSAGYVVPLGKTFTVKILIARFSSAFAGDAAITIGYNDVDTGILAGGGGTNDVFFGIGGPTPISGFGLIHNSCTVGEEKAVPVDNFIIPTGKYPLIFMNSAGSPIVQVSIYGVEA